jgi:predicted transcriptional regulator
MNTLTLKIPEELDAALQVASARRQISKSALVREALEKALESELKQATAASRWLSRWRGALRDIPDADVDQARLTHLVNKHLR